MRLGGAGSAGAVPGRRRDSASPDRTPCTRARAHRARRRHTKTPCTRVPPRRARNRAAKPHAPIPAPASLPRRPGPPRIRAAAHTPSQPDARTKPHHQNPMHQSPAAPRPKPRSKTPCTISAPGLAAPAPAPVPDPYHGAHAVPARCTHETAPPKPHAPESPPRRARNRAAKPNAPFPPAGLAAPALTPAPDPCRGAHAVPARCAHEIAPPKPHAPESRGTTPETAQQNPMHHFRPRPRCPGARACPGSVPRRTRRPSPMRARNRATKTPCTRARPHRAPRCAPKPYAPERAAAARGLIPAAAPTGMAARCTRSKPMHQCAAGSAVTPSGANIGRPGPRMSGAIRQVRTDPRQRGTAVTAVQGQPGAAPTLAHTAPSAITPA